MWEAEKAFVVLRIAFVFQVFYHLVYPRYLPGLTGFDLAAPGTASVLWAETMIWGAERKDLAVHALTFIRRPHRTSHLSDHIIKRKSAGQKPRRATPPTRHSEPVFVYRLVYRLYIIKMKIRSSCEIEYFVETHLCKLCVILRSRVLRVVCPH